MPSCCAMVSAARFTARPPLRSASTAHECGPTEESHCPRVASTASIAVEQRWQRNSSPSTVRHQQRSHSLDGWGPLADQ